jgi:hypothetical protein
LNMGDHFTKPLPKLLFYRHRDFYMGHVPPPYSPKYQECLRVLCQTQNINNTQLQRQNLLLHGRLYATHLFTRLNNRLLPYGTRWNAVNSTGDDWITLSLL